MLRTLTLLCSLSLFAACATGEQWSDLDGGSVERGTSADLPLPVADTRADQRRDTRVDVHVFPDQGVPDLPAPDLAAPDLATPDLMLPDSTVDAGEGVLVAPFTLDFEQDDGGLVGDKDWQWGALGSWDAADCSSSTTPHPTQAHSGQRLWGTVLDGCYEARDNASSGCDNDDITDDSILAIEVAIPAGWSTASLSYWEWRDIFTPFDWAEIRVDDAVVLQICSGGTLATWTKQTIDLSAYIGQRISITFHMMASSVINYAGWYLDDLSVHGV